MQPLLTIAMWNTRGLSSLRLSVSSSRSSYHVPRPNSRGQLHFTWLRQFRCNGGRTWTVDTGLGVTMAMTMQLLANGQQVKWKQIQFSEDRSSPLLNYFLINFCLCLRLNLMRILNQYSLFEFADDGWINWKLQTNFLHWCQ